MIPNDRECEECQKAYGRKPADCPRCSHQHPELRDTPRHGGWPGQLELEMDDENHQAVCARVG